jgi:hypothetical protein
MRIFIFVISFFLLFNSLYSHKRTYNWHFGHYAGITFNRSDTCIDPPCILGSKIYTRENCASMSDKSGNLLFYTNGVTIWNSKNEIMSNGDSLYGHPSSSQGVIIIPNPSIHNIYYVFTIDGNENYKSTKGLNYSVVDMTFDNGLGEVIKKNIHLLDNCAEKIASTLHHNCKDIWIVVHGFNNNYFFSFLITKDGVNLNPVISQIGSIYTNEQGPFNTSDIQGYLKISSNSRIIATTICFQRKLELFNFDNKDGKIYNYKSFYPFSKTYTFPYAIEFSPNSKLLYVGCWGNDIYQYDISLNNLDDIIDSQYLVVEESDYVFNYGLQLGPDERLYISSRISSRYYLNIIEEPNLQGVECSYKQRILYLGEIFEVSSGYGLPNFISSYFAENKISLPDTVVKIDSEISIPINIDINCVCGENDPDFAYSAEIQFDASFFYPYDSPVITGNIIIDGKRILTLEGEFKPESQETVVAEIPGLVLLGSGTKTTLKINKFEILNSDINIKTEDGSLEIYGVCQPELSQITLFEPLDLIILPNPAEESVKFRFKTITASDILISISNYMGNIVKEYKAKLSNEREIELDVSDLASGIYFATVKAGGRIETKKFAVVR